MKNMMIFCLLVLMTVPMGAVENNEVMYAGGTVPSVKQSTVGRLDLTSDTALRFEYSPEKLEIPFSRIDSWEYSREVSHHLGVLPAIAVGMLKRRERRHFFRISFHDENKAPQVAIFEVSKKVPAVIEAALQTRVPQNKCHCRNAAGIKESTN